MSKNRAGAHFFNYVSLIVIIAMSICFVYIAGLNTYASELLFGKAKTVRRGVLPENAPVETLDFRLEDGVTQQTGGRFNTNDPDWYKNLTFKIRNMTYKKMRYVLMAIYFPDTENTGPVMVYNYSIGRPNDKKYSATSINFNSPIEISSGGDLTVRMGDKFDDIKKFIALREQSTEINSIVIRFHKVVFDDETIWNPNIGWYKFDPENPAKNLEINPPDLIYKKQKQNTPQV